MRKTTYFISLLFFVVFSAYAQENYTRIKILNPDQHTINTIASNGIDLSCGAHHEHNELILELSQGEVNLLAQDGISFITLIDDVSSFYKKRAKEGGPHIKHQHKHTDGKSKEIITEKSSVSNIVIDNIIQYSGEDEINFIEPQNFPNVNTLTMGGCLTVSQMEAQLDAMRSYSQSNGLDIVSPKTDASSSGQKTWGNPNNNFVNQHNNGPSTYSGTGSVRWNPQTIYYVRITGNESTTPEGTKPQILYTSMIHSRELSALMNNIYFMWYIIENYNTDPAIKELVDNNELYFVPVVNPDGLRYNEVTNPNGGGMQRKNLRPLSNGTIDPNRGVDLNRNFDYYWGLNNIGSSGTSSSGTYRGPGPESEPETQIMVDFISSRSFKSAVWNHSFANSVPHPYGGDPNNNTGREDEYYRWHEEMTRYNRYLYGATIFYESNGLPDDWMMGGDPDNNNSTGLNQAIIATTPEHGGEGFWPSISSIVPIAKRSMRISLATAYYGGKYAKLHDLTQSNITSLNSNLDFGIERIGQTQSGFTVTVTPISSNIVSITSPPTQTGIPINTTGNSNQNQRNVSASLVLDPSINPNDKIEYKVQFSNDDGIIYEVNYEKYYQPTILFSNSPDTDGLTGWTQSGGWTTTTSDAFSGSTSINTGTYSNNANKTLTTTGNFDFSNATEVKIQFYTKWDIERNYDYVEVLGSPDGGSNWISLKGNYTKPNATSATTSHDNKSSTYANFQANSNGQIYDGDRMDNWVMEEITIDNNYASLLNSNNVKIRFRFRTDALNVNESYTTTNDGFFIDDFKIISITIPCATTVPNNLSTDTVLDTSASIVWDDIPSATYDLRYRETGTSIWNEITDIPQESYTINGLTELTEYEVQVRSRCTSSTSVYSSSIQFTTLEEITCTGTLVNSFPYTETFDTDLGEWTQASGDDGNWSLNSNGTQSNNTGPQDDITGGGNYLYTEASTAGLGSNANVILISPCFNLANITNGIFTFNYHMFGSDLGTLELDISLDDGISWNNLFSQTGGSEEIWKLESFDLSSYGDAVVKFRFSATTGNGWSSDIAIDQISITELPTNYCDSQATDTNLFLGIGGVMFNTINNTSNAQLYSDFTSVSTMVSKSTTYTLTITPEYNVGTNNAVGYAAWIDYNRDGDFTDPGEQVYTRNPVTGGNSVSGNVAIPANISNGATIMRVALKFNDVPTSCETFQYGEVEDYKIYLFNGLLFQNNTWTPNAPSGVTSSEDVMVLNGTYNTNADISVNNINVATGATLNISKENTITVNGSIVNNGDFIMNSDSNEFSSLILTGNATANLKYNRHVNSSANRNDLISPPFSGESFVNFRANNANILSNTGETLYLFGPFDKSTSDYLTYASTEVSTLQAGKGYRTASTDNGTFTFTGSVTTGNLSIPIEKTGSAFEIWNLIGNPYPSYISLDDFLTDNLSEFDTQSAAVYGYDADNSNGSYWTIFNLAYALANPNTLIAPGQGFFVSSKDGGGTVNFLPSMRRSGSSDDFISGRSNNPTEFGTIVLSSDAESFSTDLYITDNASLGIDVGYDASHFDGAPSDFAIYSHLVSDNAGRDMAIQAINFNDLNDTTVIPLGVNVPEGQQVTISFNNTSISTDVYLEDVVLNTFTLLNTSDYTFTPSSSISDTGRFYLRFDVQTLSNNDSNLDILQVYSEHNNEQIVVKGLLEYDTEVVVYDIQGRHVHNSEFKAGSTINKINTSDFSTGVYLVRVSDQVLSITKKVIVK
ncbi:hypothetical protein BWZ20_14325 [Winogradskyella sp. J14-2]|uniref:M14 family zinc carboxypeptidase n=1 Tax=Winogradskyella sp. J14-2 TaxID=1936080 RepID=UPI0009728C7A|nr:M14 family zinc carboxypeptidase [Winogradskyella sp. J14-2]APY09410.1 hypothetical protein BWZ20_14325 [Winogradskyella sp. J14-2]